MTKLLQKAIQLLRQFPSKTQDKIARVLISQLEEEPERGDLGAIREGRKAFERGEFITLEEWRTERGFKTP